MSTVLVPYGGSIAINGSHVNVSKLESTIKEPLVLTVRKSPELGELSLTGHNGTEVQQDVRLTQHDLNQLTLVYSHTDKRRIHADPTDPHEDHVQMEVFPASEEHARRRSMRLKITVYVQIMPSGLHKFRVR